jgi:hypothetical protein
LGYIPISVASLTQTGGHVAYVIMTKEDSAAHTFIIDATECQKNEMSDSRKIKLMLKQVIVMLKQYSP